MSRTEWPKSCFVFILPCSFLSSPSHRWTTFFSFFFFFLNLDWAHWPEEESRRGMLLVVTLLDTLSAFAPLFNNYFFSVFFLSSKSSLDTFLPSGSVSMVWVEIQGVDALLALPFVTWTPGPPHLRLECISDLTHRYTILQVLVVVVLLDLYNCLH